MTNDAHERLKRSARALHDASIAWWSRDRSQGWDYRLWNNLQRAEMAVRHALADEDSGIDFVCPCRTCREIGGVDPGRTRKEGS